MSALAFFGLTTIVFMVIFLYEDAQPIKNERTDILRHRRVRIDKNLPRLQAEQMN